MLKFVRLHNCSKVCQKGESQCKNMYTTTGVYLHQYMNGKHHCSWCILEVIIVVKKFS